MIARSDSPKIEEALKLYQNALKLHSQGPDSYEEAETAYKALFSSEVFTYSESLSETQWLDLYGESDAYEDGIEDDLVPDISAPAVSSDGAPSTLPQILYLAYKNHGQFRLDRLKVQLARIEQSIRSNDLALSPKDNIDAASAGLKDLAHALDRDESDLDLWRKVSRVSEVLGSERVARYCLEAVLDTDESGVSLRTEILGIEASLAGEQLRHLLSSIDDQISEKQLRALPCQQKQLVSALYRHVDPLPYLPRKFKLVCAKTARNDNEVQEIAIPVRSLASVGKTILLRINQQAQAVAKSQSAVRYYLRTSAKEDIGAIAPLHDDQRHLGNDTDDRGTATNNSMSSHVVSPTLVSFEKSALTGTDDVIPLSPTDPCMDSVEHVDPRTAAFIPHDNNEFPIHGLGIQGADVQDQYGQNVPPASKEPSCPNRKRSSDTAELPDATELGRSKSKRIKAKGFLTESVSLKEPPAEETAQWYEKQLQIYVHADGLAFQSADSLLSKLGCQPIGSAENLRRLVMDVTVDERFDSLSSKSHDTVLHDLKAVLDTWNPGKSKIFLHGDGSKELTTNAQGSQHSGFSTFLEHSARDVRAVCQLPNLPDDIKLDDFFQSVNGRTFFSLEQIAFQWIHEILGMNQSHDTTTWGMSLYEQYIWPDTLKEAIVQMLVNQDEYIFSEMTKVKDGRDCPVISHGKEDQLVAFVQIIFELHLDIYGRITNPSSEVDPAIRTLQRDRLSRWAALSGEFLARFNLSDVTYDSHLEYGSQLSIRFLWASIVCNNLVDPNSNDFAVICYGDMIRLMKTEIPSQDSDCFVIRLPNNAIMPEISVDAAEKEVSRLTNMDFFSSIFDSDNNDPLAVIHSLEPLLELSIQSTSSDRGATLEASMIETEQAECSDQGETLIKASANPRLQEALQFLDQASLDLRLYLWQRLRDAYSVINYPPQIFVCNLRCLALIVRYLTSSSYAEQKHEARLDVLLCWMHNLDDLLNQLLTLAQTDTSAFEYVDNEHLCSAAQALATLQKIIHCFAMWEDSIRIGQKQPTAQGSNAGAKAQVKSADKLREMMVKSWTLQYLLGKEAMTQFSSKFETPGEDLINYLKLAHRVLGLRCYCSLANKMFLKLAKVELIRLKDCDGWDIDMAQIIFDLHGLKITTDASQTQDHVCETVELDKQTALDLIDLVMLHVNRLSIRDLLKNDLKFTVDKMQQVIKVPKPTTSATARTFNRRLVLNYLKSPIHPAGLYQARKGLGGICGFIAHTDGSAIAAKGWYFLLGQIALTKFRSQKRISPGSMEDLDVAKAFFRQDLEFNPEKWETWFRLAQAYDTSVDEMVTWTAEKLDNEMDKVADAQREAVLCYTMALGIATRTAGTSVDEMSMLADLYSDFGTRIYASTREPFSMQAFNLRHFERHYNGQTQGMYNANPFPPLEMYPAWVFARSLLQKAAVQKPQWRTFYILGKVLWKMYNATSDTRRHAHSIGYKAVIDAFVKAVNFVPGKRDNRHSDKDPILEPHYKLVSIVHKLVRKHELTQREGSHVLHATPYSRKFSYLEFNDDWEGYIEQILKSLRAADKSNWHHRMVARAAQTMYEKARPDPPNENRNITGAKNELTQQIFTKTMIIQVWRPDNERSGRHFVYTSRYVRFIVRILSQLKDKESLETLARRIRKKVADFVDHVGVWRELSLTYLKLLRDSVHAPVDYEEHLFKNYNPEEFALNASRLEAWIHSPNTICEHLDELRSAIEYKKLNNGLLKATTIEDLIADIYSVIYDTNIQELKARETAEENRVRMRLNNILDADPSGVNGTSAVADEPKEDPMAQYKRKPASVTRREIIRKAEALMTKPPPIATPKPAARVIISTPEMSRSTEVAVVIPQSLAREETSVPGSPEGSLHDSADDESGLSDADEAADGELAGDEIEQKPGGRAPPFPNLDGAHDHTETNDTSEPGSEQGDGNIDDGLGPEDTDAHDEQPDIRDEQSPGPLSRDEHQGQEDGSETPAVDTLMT